MNFSWDFASDLGYKVPRLDLAINLQLVEPQGLKLQNRETLTSLFFSKCTETSSTRAQIRGLKRQLSGGDLGLHLKLFLKYFLSVWVFCLSVCLCNTCVPGAHGGQKASGDLELDLHVSSDVSLIVSVGNYTWVP